jgi:DNA polymerase-1
MNQNRFVIFDGNALIHRAYHAIPYLTTRDGRQVNAVYGFANTLLKVLQDLRPKYAAVTFDLPAPTFRHKEYKEYKATRVKADQELYDQIPLVKELVRAFNIPIYEKEGYEADDAIGTIAKNLELRAKNLEIIIVTGDLDTLQLIDDNTKVYSISRGINQAVMYDDNKVLERYGIRPDQMVDYKALRGDPSDNIPGVSGIGEKGAAKLIIEFQNLENIYKNLDKISEKNRNLLTENKEQAFLSQKLSKIDCEVPIDFSFSACRLHDYHKQKVIDLFSKLEFKSLIRKLPEEKRDGEQAKLF